MLAGCYQVSLRTEVAIDHAMCREETVCLFGRLEARHLPLSPSGGSMRVLGPIVQVATAPMLDLGQELTLGYPVALKPISD